MSNLSILYTKDGRDVSAFLTGSLVSLAAINLKSKLKNIVTPKIRLIVDLTEVTEVDTTAINSLFQTRMHCDDTHSKLILRCSSSHPIKKLLRLTASENQFDFISA